MRIRGLELGFKAKTGIAVILALSVLALSSRAVGVNPYKLYNPYTPPCRSHLLGTDDVGHDVLTLLLLGSGTSLLVGFLTASLAVSIGLALSLLCYFDRLDSIIARVSDFFLVIPRLPMLIVLSALLKPNVLVVVLILVFFGWPFTTRVLRPVVRQVRSESFVELLRSDGFSSSYIIVKHIAPHLTPLIIAQFVLEARHAVIAEAGIGFLGFEQPTTISLGVMLYHAFMNQYTFASNVWLWTVLPPALTLALLSLAFTLIGMDIEDKYKPWTWSVRF